MKKNCKYSIITIIFCFIFISQAFSQGNVLQNNGVDLFFKVFLHSDEVYPIEKMSQDKLSIYKAVDEAVNNNLLFRIKEQDIKIAESENLSYWSVFLPQVDYSMEYYARDNETARQRGYPKYLYKHGFSLSQLIFSDPAIRDMMNSKKAVSIKKLEKDSAALDITAETSTAYLNYLKAKSFIKVEEENLEELEADLKIAEERTKKGFGSEDEILRWKSEISKAKSDVIEAGTIVVMARVILNQLMNRPQSSKFKEEDVGLEMARYYLGTQYLNSIIGDFNALESVMGFIVDEAIKRSPEIQIMDIAIKQQKQKKNTAARKFILPEAHLTGDLRNTLDRKYIDGGSHEDDHPDWTVGLKMSYPLFEGGDKAFDYDKEKTALERLYVKKELAEQNLELEVRKSCYLMYHSYKNIALSHSSTIDASKNLVMIGKKYVKGSASMTDMIVAQQDKISKERNAVVSVYDFLSNIVKFDRSISIFYFLASSAERQEWLKELDGYLKEKQ